MCSIGEYVDTGVRTQVRFCRALAATRFAAATQGACLATRPAMPGIGSMIHARAFTLPVSLGAGAHSAHTTRAASAGDVATPAIVPITRQVYTSNATHLTVGWAGARAPNARLPLIAYQAAFTTIASIVEHVNASVAAIQEPRRTRAKPFSATLGSTTNIAASTAVSRIVVEPSAITPLAQSRAIAAFGHALVAETHQVAAIVSTRATVVVVCSKIDTGVTAETSPGRTTASSGYALLRSAACKPAAATVVHVRPHVDARIAAQILTKRALTHSRVTRRLRGTRVTTLTAVELIDVRVHALLAARREITLAVAAAASTQRAFSTSRTTGTAVRVVAAQVDAILVATLRTAGLHSLHHFDARAFGIERGRHRIDEHTFATTSSAFLGLRARAAPRRHPEQ